VRSARAAFEAVDPGLGRAARTLGCSRIGEFLAVTLPLAWPGLLAGSVLCFARALGEFGATRMVSLNTDGQRTLALEVFQLVETPGPHGHALLRLVLFSVMLSLLALAACEGLARRWKRGAT
jgi:molybdate transport system permease protein